MLLMGSAIAFVAPASAFDRELASSEVEKLEANISKDPQSITSVKFLIKHYHEKSKWKDLIRIAQPVQKNLDPANSYMVLDAYNEIKDFTSATALVGHMQAKNKPSAELKMEEAKIYVAMANSERMEERRMKHANTALLTLRAAVELEPKNEEIYIAWVDLLKEFYPYYAFDAVHVIKTMEEKTGDYETHNPLKCELFTKASLWDQGVVACQRAITANPRDVMSHIYLAEVKGVKVGPEERMKMLKQTAKDFPKHYHAQKTLADLLFDEKDFVSAVERYKTVLAVKKDDVASLLRLAESEFRAKQFDAALVSYKKHCKNSRMVASEFKEATKQLRSSRNLHTQYYEAMQSCR